MRIVFDARTATPHFPGVGRYVRSLLPALRGQRRPDEELTVLLPPGRPEDLAAVAEAGIEVGGHALAPGSLWRVRRLVRRLAPDVVHAPYPFALPPAHGPFVVTVHDLIPLSHPHLSSVASRLFWRLLAAPVLRRAAALVAVSQATADEMAARLRVTPGKITVVHHGVDARFRPVPAERREELRRRLGLPPAYLLCLASDRPHKNLMTLFRAQAEAGAEALPLVVAGLQSGEGPCRQEAARLGLDGRCLLWLGTVTDEDLPALYSASRALVLPSIIEGFGLPVLEALACGTAVFTSDVPALAEVSGGFATRLPALDVTAWADALRGAAAGAPAPDPDAAARHLAGFTWQRAAAETWAIYRKLK